MEMEKIDLELEKIMEKKNNLNKDGKSINIGILYDEIKSKLDSDKKDNELKEQLNKQESLKRQKEDKKIIMVKKVKKLTMKMKMKI